MYWSYVLTAGGVLGIYLAGKKNLWGWALGFSMQWLWVVYAFQTKQYGFILSAIAYGAVYGRNFYLWHNDKKKPKETPHKTVRAYGRGYQPHHTVSPEQFNNIFSDEEESEGKK